MYLFVQVKVAVGGVYVMVGYVMLVGIIRIGTESVGVVEVITGVMFVVGIINIGAAAVGVVVLINIGTERVGVIVGAHNTCPTCNKVHATPVFNAFNSINVIPNLVAILSPVSPCTTVYLLVQVGVGGVYVVVG